MTKEELTAAIAAFAKKKGHPPSRAEVMKYAGATRRDIRKHFGTLYNALEACGLQGRGAGKKVKMEDLFHDWAGIVRKLKKVPSLTDYEQKSKYSIRPLIRVFGAWSNVPDGMKFYAIEQGLAEEHKDVLEAIEQRTTPSK